jgi:hypothetical protein
MKQPRPPIATERKTMELCGSDVPGGKCILALGHHGEHHVFPSELAFELPTVRIGRK